MLVCAIPSKSANNFRLNLIIDAGRVINQKRVSRAAIGRTQAIQFLSIRTFAARKIHHPFVHIIERGELLFSEVQRRLNRFPFEFQTYLALFMVFKIGSGRNLVHDGCGQRRTPSGTRSWAWRSGVDRR